MTTDRPLILLDVDGVINAIGPRFGPMTSERAGDFTIQLPDYMPALVQHLTTVGEIMWCTAWRHEANKHIAPLLGVSPLAVVDDGTKTRYTDWKAAAALPFAEAALADGRQVIWIEDFDGFPPYREMPEGTQFIDTTEDGTWALRPEHLPAFLLEGWERPDLPCEPAA